MKRLAFYLGTKTREIPGGLEMKDHENNKPGGQKNAIKSVTFQAFTVMVRRMRISIRGTVKIWRHAVTVHGIVCG